MSTTAIRGELRIASGYLGTSYDGILRAAGIEPQGGDTRVVWDPTNETEVEVAKSVFRQLRAEGFQAFAIDPVDGGAAERLDEWDPEAKRMVMVAPLMGG